MKRPPPFRADHVGSLLRPARLRKAFRDHAAGIITAEEFQAIQDDSIREVVQLQENVGLQSITDGEFRRASYWAHFVAAVEGLEVRPAVYHFTDNSGAAREFTAPHVSGKVHRPHSISGHEFEFLQHATAATPKVTLPSPPTMHFWRGSKAISPAAYIDREAFFEDLARVYREEIADLHARGARYLQIDEVPLAMLCDPDVRNVLTSAGEDPEQLVEAYIRLVNAALAGRPDDLTIAMHLCRGNYKGRWLASGGYGYIAARAFAELDVDAFFLEYDTPRAGDFAPLEHMTPGKTVVLGLVSSKTPELEQVDDLRHRIDEAARYVPLKRLAISPQCGFASTAAGNPVTLDDEIAKLELVVEVARSVWGAE